MSVRSYYAQIRQFYLKTLSGLEECPKKHKKDKTIKIKSTRETEYFIIVQRSNRKI